MTRYPNCKCSNCSKPIYRRPKDLERFVSVYCSRICYGKHKRCNKKCIICGNEFHSDKASSRYCSRSCSNQGRLGIKYQKGSPNRSVLMLNKLKTQFQFEKCMVEGCEYNKTFDIHRFVPGKDGGEYVIGNMFAICPNHHAEVTRRLIELEKVSDCLLKVRKRSEGSALESKLDKRASIEC